MLIPMALPANSAATHPRLDLRLYTLDCGRLDFTDLGPVSDTGDYEGKRGFMVDSCFLIHHAQTWILWDTGVGDDIAAMPGGKNEFGYQATLKTTLGVNLRGSACNLTT